MKLLLNFTKAKLGLFGGIFIALSLFWFLLYSTPFKYTQPFQAYSFGLFLFVIVGYYFTYKLSNDKGIILGIGFTMLLLALTLAYKWQSGYSDNFLIGGLLPYKDGKNYFFGANLILNGFPLEKANQATERPLFPGFFSSLLALTGSNLKLSIALLVQFSGIGLYYSSRKVFHSFGAISASLYSTLLFFYIQPWAGYIMSEIFGFTAGCIAFTILWNAARKPIWANLIVGMVILLIAVSARAGTFLIFPLLAIWVGFTFRNNERFSIKAFIYSMLLILITYLLLNTGFARLLGVPEGSSFGNFSYALYGQVRGGTGWHTAIEDLQTRDPAIVFEAAFDFFRRHPFSLLIGFLKSYRDFFLPGFPNIFPFAVSDQPIWITYSIWSVVIIALFFGLFRLLKKHHHNLATFLLAGFIGVLLSIPLLPPVDGGSRFYASTVPFFFVIPAVGLTRVGEFEPSEPKRGTSDRILHYLAYALLVFTIIMPVLIYSMSTTPKVSAVSCPVSQEPFVIQANPDSYLNFINRDKSYCHAVPDVCLTDFVNNTEYKVDDFYQKIHSIAQETGGNVRIIPSINLLDKIFHYFIVDLKLVPEDFSREIISGCAIEIKTKNQSIYFIETIKK